ncbi:hypothetical protein [Nostoc sp.]
MNDAPVAVNDSITTNKNTPVIIRYYARFGLVSTWYQCDSRKRSLYL